MMPELLLATFTDKGKQVSTGLDSGVDTGLKTETGRTVRDQQGSVLQPVQAAPDVLHLAA